jgi:hypothetical protein
VLSLPVPLVVLLAAAVMAGALAAFGWFQPAVYPDTEGYLRAAASATPWSLERHPLYGWMLMALERAGFGRSAVPALQFALQAVAASALAAAARLLGFDRRAALALGLAALLGQTVVIWGRALLPEAPATALMLMATALVLAAIRERLFWAAAVLAALALGLAYTLRPILLPAIALLPALYLLLCLRDRQGWRWLRCGALVLLFAVPLIAQSAHRYREVGHFGLVSFGGFGLMGMASQILSVDIVPGLPEGQRALAMEVLAAKARAEEARTAMPLFRDSSGERSFRVTAIDGFDTLARNFDEILWGQVLTLRRPGEGWIEFDRRMGDLAGAILRAAPERHLMWMAGASARLAGRLLVYNVAFVLACAAFALAALWNVARAGDALAGASGSSWTPLALIIGVWVASTSGLTVGAAFPALRYTDTAGLLMTALPLYGLFLALGKTNSADPA